MTLGHLAALDTDLRLGTLVSPVTLHHAGVLAKQAATLDVISGGRAFCGVGAGWFEREHTGIWRRSRRRERLDTLATTIETMRALWAPGTNRMRVNGFRCPRPPSTGDATTSVLVGGSGARTLRIAGALDDVQRLVGRGAPGRIAAVRRAAERAGRDPDDVAMTVLDVAVVGETRDDTARRVERLRGRTPAATYAARHHAGEPAALRALCAAARDGGQRDVSGPPGPRGPDDLDRCAALTR